MRRPLAVTLSFPILVSVGLLPGQAPIRLLDLAGDSARQVTVHRDGGKYLGHPTTVMLPDGRTMLCVHPEGHGRGAIVLQRSEDAGLTWSAPLPVPESWATSKETPTIHRLVDPRDGTARLVLFSGLYPIRSSVSVDDGVTWTELLPIGDFGGIVAMASVVRLHDGSYAAFFHDDGRYFREGGERAQFTVYQTRSADGGLTWGAPSVVWSGPELDLCEPGVIRSPDGAQLAMLLRENSRRAASQLLLSDDEGATWRGPTSLPWSLTGDRHVGAYDRDGRLLLSFRDMAPGSATRGDWVAWVGTWPDLVAHGRDGRYRVRLSRNWQGTDCAYPGVEVAGDGTFVLTTYGHWEPGERPFVRCVRLKLRELDALAAEAAPFLTHEPGTVVPTARQNAKWQARVDADLQKARTGGHRLVMLGDSITEGWNTRGQPLWDEFWQPRRALNLGISGDRTQHVLWRLDRGLLEALAAPNNDVGCVVLMIGTNNSNGSDHSASEIALGVDAVVRRLRGGLPTARVLLLSIFPRGERPNAQREKNAVASSMVASWWRDDPMVACRDIGERFVAADGSIDKAIMPDFLHLTVDGYRRWAEAIVADVDRLLSSK